LRSTFGAVQGRGQWRRRLNLVLHKLYEPGLAKYIKINRLKWAGHVTRMDNSLPPGQKEKEEFEDLN
jgi:hypothetical protein